MEKGGGERQPKKNARLLLLLEVARQLIICIAFFACPDAALLLLLLLLISFNCRSLLAPINGKSNGNVNVNEMTTAKARREKKTKKTAG